jgi:hypothetical protein
VLLTLLSPSGVAAGVTASGAITLDAVAIDGVGTSYVVSSGAITLDAMTVAGSGTSTVQASGVIALDAVSVAGVGTSTVQATGAVTLGAVSIAGAGDWRYGSTGTGAISLDDATSSGLVTMVTLVRQRPTKKTLLFSVANPWR